MRTWWVLLLLAPMLAGCLTVFDEDRPERDVEPADRPEGMDAVRVSSVRSWDLQVTSFDGTALSTLVYEPLTADALPDDSPPEWPVVVFLHGLGFTKEYWQTTPIGTGEPVDLLDRFAREGFLVVAYDARGFGQSGGQATFAGAAERADLEAVLDHVMDRFTTNGQAALTGFSYGAGQALQGWARDDRVVTAVPLHGWSDLPQGLMPAHVPKIGWMNFLFAASTGTSAGAVHPDLYAWYQSAYLRAQEPAEFAATEAELALRDIDVTAVDKPLLVCQGMQESLFPQVDLLVEAGGFTRGYVHPGGHGAQDAGCWDRALDWLRFFLQGIDTEVDDWPALETVDARDNDRFVRYGAAPRTSTIDFGLREPDLTEAEYANETFTIVQRGIGNPLATPAGISDVLGRPPQALPGQFGEDPQGVFFTSAPMESGKVLLGSPRLVLHHSAGDAPFQVVATLSIEEQGGMRTPIAHGAAAALEEAGNVTIMFPWTKADMAPGERIVLEVAANDPGQWLALLADYEVSFAGTSTLHVPLFDP